MPDINTRFNGSIPKGRSDMSIHTGGFLTKDEGVNGFNWTFGAPKLLYSNYNDTTALGAFFGMGFTLLEKKDKNKMEGGGAGLNVGLTFQQVFLAWREFRLDFNSALKTYLVPADETGLSILPTLHAGLSIATSSDGSSFIVGIGGFIGEYVSFSANEAEPLGGLEISLGIGLL